jgi:hypothetical protein
MYIVYHSDLSHSPRWVIQYVHCISQWIITLTKMSNTVCTLYITVIYHTIRPFSRKTTLFIRLDFRWTEIVKYCIKRGHPPYTTTFSLQNRWPYKKGILYFCSLCIFLLQYVHCISQWFITFTKMSNTVCTLYITVIYHTHQDE